MTVLTCNSNGRQNVNLNSRHVIAQLIIENISARSFGTLY